MTCRKSLELDLADFVLDPSADAWVAFRAHYPACGDCAAEVAVWEEMQAFLRSGGPGGTTAHPPKELLLRYEEHRSTLSAIEAALVEKHLASCRTCPDELAALRTFDFSVVRSPLSLRPAPWWTRALEMLASRMRPVVLHPAFAYALALILLYPALIRPRLAGHRVPAEQIARDSSREPADARRGPVVDNARPEVRSLPPATEHMTGVSPEATAPHALHEDAPAAPAVARDAAPPSAGDARLAAARRRSRPTAAQRAQPAGPAAADHAANDAPAAEKPPGADGAENAPEDMDETDGSDALVQGEPADVDADEPRVLGLADTEVPHDDARPAPPTAKDAGVAREDATNDPSWATIVLTPSRTPVVQRAAVATGILLRLPPTDREVEIRVVGPNGQETAAETVQSPSGEPLAVRIRMTELIAGTYRVLTRVKGSAASEEPAELRFLVR